MAVWVSQSKQSVTRGGGGNLLHAEVVAIEVLIQVCVKNLLYEEVFREEKWFGIAI